MNFLILLIIPKRKKVLNIIIICFVPKTLGRIFVTYSPKSKSAKQHIIFVHGEWFGKWFWDNFSDFFVANGIDRYE
jgi:hypothetical protein